MVPQIISQMISRSTPRALEPFDRELVDLDSSAAASFEDDTLKMAGLRVTKLRSNRPWANINECVQNRGDYFEHLDRYRPADLEPSLPG